MTDIPMNCSPDDSCHTPEEDYEEITSDEVDRVVAALDELIETTVSLNIRACLEEAAANVYGLVYDEDDLDDLSEAA